MLTCAAEIIQEAYITFRENTWDTSIVKFEDQGDTLVLHDGDPWKNPRYFIKFPYNVVPSDRQTKLSVLTVWTCEEPYAFLCTLIMKLLKGTYCFHQLLNYARYSHTTGLDIEVEEVAVGLKAVPRKITVVPYFAGERYSNWPAYRHNILRITSRRSRQQWVMDIAGGQYGIYEPFHTWAKYKADFVDEIISVNAVGSNKMKVAALSKVPGVPTLVYGIVGEASEELNKAIHIWEDTNRPLSGLRELSAGETSQQKRSLLDALDKAVHDYMTTNDFEAQVRQAKAHVRAGS
jgi:hypothetical protein